jgi:microcystin-dependent protein
MTDVPDLTKRIQQEEVQFRAPVSESTWFKIGGVINYILDHYVIPPGAIMTYAGPESTVPSGWLVADGSAVSRVTYANLFAVFGTMYGDGDGITTFNLPDYRGMFHRMVQKTASGFRPFGGDPDHASRTPSVIGASPEDPGSYQDYDLGTHAHQLPTFSSPGSPVQICVLTVQNTNVVYSSQTSFSGGQESRPINMYVIYLVKW